MTDSADDLSPYTGWVRSTWEAHADSLLNAAMQHGSAGHARVRMPGPESAQGRDSDELEGFARSFLLAAFRMSGDRDGRSDLAAWYAAGLQAGTDPRSSERWPSLDQANGQPRVEAASIAIGLHLTRDQLWDALDPQARQHVVDWLMTSVGARYHEHNWLWFQLVVSAFLRSVGATSELRDRDWGLRRNEFLYRGSGWYADGDGLEFDHYNGWAFHFYPLLWTMMEPDRDTAADFSSGYRSRLSRFLNDAVNLVDASGSPLIQGRSLTYRYAAAAPFWMGAMTGATDLPPGLLRRAASGMVSHFADRGNSDEGLPIGWHGESIMMRQSYSGFSSPYWAAKGMLGLALPATHPVWTAREEALPVERGDVVQSITAPGWAVSATQADGIVRVANHGAELSGVAEHPQYSRIAYSTATFPLQCGPDVDSPLGNAVAVLDDHGTASHRRDLEPRGTATSDGVAAAYSRHIARWPATVRRPVRMSLASVLRGPWEIRIVECEPGDHALRLGGWPISADTVPVPVSGGVSDTDGTQSRIVLLSGTEIDSGVAQDVAVSPLGRHSATPWLTTHGHGPVVAAVGLGRSGLDTAPELTIEHGRLSVQWPGGQRTDLIRRDDDGLAEWRLADAEAVPAVAPQGARKRLSVALCIDQGMRTRLFGEEELARLAEIGDVIAASPRLEASEELRGADVIVTSWGSSHAGAPLHIVAPGARFLLHAAGTVKPVVDEGSMRAGLQVSSMADVNATPVVEYALAVIALAAKGLLPEPVAEHAFDLTAEWGGFGTAVGIVGASRIGRRVLAGLRDRDVTVLLSDPYLSDAGAAALGAELTTTEELFRRSRVVSLHAPLLESTRGMVTEKLLASMQPNAVLINTARGALVDEKALVDELESGRLRAILDVTDPEPVPADSPLRTLHNVLLTHHLAGTAGNEYRRIGRAAIAELERFAVGRRLAHEITADELATMA